MNRWNNNLDANQWPKDSFLYSVRKTEEAFFYKNDVQDQNDEVVKMQESRKLDV